MKKVRDPDAIRAAMERRQLTFREMGLLCECAEGTIRYALKGMAVNDALARRMTRVLRGRIGNLFDDVASTTEQVDNESGAVA